MKFEQSFICVYLSTRVFRDGWHLLIHFPRRLFVKLCLVFTARMCHERFCWSADDSWADPGMLRLTGSACLNVECSGEDQAPNQPSDLHCVSERSYETSLSIIGRSMSMNRPVDTIEIRGGQIIAGCCHLLARRHMGGWQNQSCGKYHAFSFSFFTLNSILILQLKQSWISSSEVDAATLSAM